MSRRPEISHPDQVSAVRRYIGNEGLYRNQRFITVSNGVFDFTVQEDHCLDILDIRYKGINLCFLPKNGYYSNGADDIPGGMFFTCGLKHVGAKDAENPLHGTIRNRAAEQVSTSISDGKLTISGTVRQGSLFGENLQLDRTITTETDAQEIFITDTIFNDSDHDEEIMLLYHVNFGYPLLSSQAEITIPSRAFELRGERIRQLCEDTAYAVHPTEPVSQKEEQVSYHELVAPEGHDGFAACTLYNPELQVGVELSFKLEELPVFTLWESYASGDYAVGFEPGWSHVEGMETERQRWVVTTLGPYEERTVHLKYRVFDQPVS